MKNLYNLFELILIVCLVVLIVAPEIAYSLVLRGCDKVEEMWGRYVTIPE